MITVVGEALVDLVIDPDGSVVAALGGAPYNTAIAAARLGADVEFAGTLSTDRFGGLLAARLDDDGVGLAADRSEFPTTLAAAELDERGAASYRFYIDGTSAPQLEVDGVHASAADILFTGGLGLVLQPMANTVLELVEARSESTMVVFDINCRPKVVDDRLGYIDRVERLLAESDLVKVSDDDLGYLFPDLEPLDGAQQLLMLGASAVLVTAGSDTTSIVTDDAVVAVPVPPLSAPVVDSIGAGDTFGGSLLAWWSLAGLGREDINAANLLRAVEAAHAAAGVVVTRRGANPPHRSDLPANWL